MSEFFRVRVERVTGKNGNGYDTAEAIFDAKVWDLDLVAVVKTIYRINDSEQVCYSGNVFMPPPFADQSLSREPGGEDCGHE